MAAEMIWHMAQVFVEHGDCCAGDEGRDSPQEWYMGWCAGLPRAQGLPVPVQAMMRITAGPFATTGSMALLR